MKGQRGSILVGVMAMSLVMTLAAGGFILITANAAKDDDTAADEYLLYYTAEAGMLVGVRWVRDFTVTDNNLIADSLVLTQGPGGYDALDGTLLRVSVHRIPGGPAVPFRLVKTRATLGANKDTLQITWLVDSVNAVTLDPDTELSAYLSNWQETYLPAVP